MQCLYLSNIKYPDALIDSADSNSEEFALNDEIAKVHDQLRSKYEQQKNSQHNNNLIIEDLLLFKNKPRKSFNKRSFNLKGKF